MEIRHLRTFVCIARSGSFSRAADVLHVAQPALSQQIRQLEEEIGTALFVRHARGVRLSYAGARMLSGAEDILRRFTDLKDSMQIERATISGEVRLGLPTTVVKLLGRSIAARTEAAYPRIKLQLIEAMSGYLCDWLGKGELDLAMLYDPSFYAAFPSGMAVRPILQENFRLILPPNLSVGPPPVGINDLSDLQFVFPRRLHAIRALIDEFLSTVNVDLKITGDVDSLGTLVEMVREGHATILPGVAIAAELESGVLRAHDLEPAPSRRLNLVWPEQHSNPNAATAITDVVAETVRDMVASGRWAATAL
jgi:LysR family transcriptional regulator, nitrogen assimilation regulatory protein